MDQKRLQQGDLIRWISDWHVYAVDSLGDAHGEQPSYSYGVVLRCYQDVQIVLVYCNDSHGTSLFNLDTLDCEIINRNG